MNTDILIPVLSLSGITVAVTSLVAVFGGMDSEKYDERQLIERGRGANYAMIAALIYLLALYAGHSMDLLPWEYMGIFAAYGLVTSIIVQNAYCIFHDAHLGQGENLWHRVLIAALMGGVWLAMALFEWKRYQTSAGLNGALALDWLAEAAMLTIRGIQLRIQDRRAAKEDADGEE